jgi:hypothetical protein
VRMVVGLLSFRIFLVLMCWVTLVTTIHQCYEVCFSEMDSLKKEAM